MIASISLFISCSLQNVFRSDRSKNFTEQLFTNQNVYRILKNYSQDNSINIIDPEHRLTNQFLTFRNNDLAVNISAERKDEYDFYIKKVIIDEKLAFVVLWHRDTTTALCFYPIKSEYTLGKWLVEEITTKSIK